MKKITQGDSSESRLAGTGRSGAQRAGTSELIAAAIDSRAVELSLRNRGLKELPPELCDLRELRALDLSGNRLARIPEALFALVQLERLDLGNNRITAIDPKIANLAALRVLDVSENHLTALPDTICGALRELHLHQNRIATVPPAIVDLPLLEVLDLSSNDIALLPSLVGRFGRLRILDLSDNRLKALPEGIGGLAKLKSLDASRNRLTSVAELAALSTLEELIVDDNRIAEISETLAHLPVLRVFSAQRNAFDILPDVFVHVAGTLTRTLVSDVIRRRVTGGADPGTRYFDAPAHQVEAALRVVGSRAVEKVINLYHKGGYANCAVSLQYADGTFVGLGDITRKTALGITGDHEAELQSQAAIVRFPGSARSAGLEQVVALSEDVVSRIPGVGVVDGTTGQSLFVPPPAASWETPESARRCRCCFAGSR